MTKEYMRLKVILIIDVHVWGQASLTVSGFASSSSSCESPDEKNRHFIAHNNPSYSNNVVIFN